MCIPLYNVKKLHGGKVKPFFAEGSQDNMSRMKEI